MTEDRTESSTMNAGLMTATPTATAAKVKTVSLPANIIDLSLTPLLTPPYRSLAVDDARVNIMESAVETAAATMDTKTVADSHTGA